MFLNVHQLQKQLDKDEFQEDGSMAAFWVLNRQFQQFINSQVTLDYESQMTDKYFAAYTGIEVKQFRETLLQHMGNVKKYVAERTRKAFDDGLVVKESSGTGSRKQDTRSRSGNDIDTDNADIRPIYDEELMAKVQLTAECIIFATRQQHTKQLELNNKGRVDHVAKLLTENEHLNKEKEHLKHTYKDLYDSIKKTRVQTKDHTDSMIVQLKNKSTKNVDLKA
ncbi:hypothetical protein Tco_0305452 [Tanacetum coccineum]